MELVLLRHAQPRWIDENNQGSADPGLTSLGREKAAELRNSLGREAFDSVLVSPYKRCLETARQVFPPESHQTLQVEDWMREITLPDFSQQPAEQVGQFFENAKTRRLAEWWDGVPGGESFRDFHARISLGLHSHLCSLGVTRLRPGCKDDHHLFSVDPESYGTKHLLVSHLGTSGLILSELLHLELVPWVWESFCLDWNGVVRLETTKVSDGYIFSLRSFNERGHRDPNLGLLQRKDESSSN